MVLLTFVWKCFQDRNFHGAVVGLYEQSIESWVGLGSMLIETVWVSCLSQHGSYHVNSSLTFPSHMTGRFSSGEDFNYLKPNLI